MKKDLTEFYNWLLLNCSAKASANCHVEKLKDYFRHSEIFNQESINNFLIQKQEKFQTTTFNIYLNAFKWYAKFLKIELEFPHFKRVNVKVKHYITLDELEDLLKQINLIFRNPHKIQTILNLMFETGIRPKELITLTRKDIDFEKKSMLLRNTKTFQDRIIPLTNIMCKNLLEYFNQEAEQTNAFNISKTILKYIFMQINQKCVNLKNKLSPYTMRRSFAHNLQDIGAELSSIQHGMGHKDINTTFKYLNNSNEKARDEIRTLLNKQRR